MIMKQTQEPWSAIQNNNYNNNNSYIIKINSNIHNMSANLVQCHSTITW